MARPRKHKYTTADGFAYLTKRMLVTKAQSAGKHAASNAMEEMGYVVVVEGTNIVRKYKTGEVELVGQIAH
jgi:hypothetical protein